MKKLIQVFWKNQNGPMFKNIFFIIGLILIFLGCFCIFQGCTYSINMIHSSGTASDLIDENQKADADIAPSFPIPGVL